MTFLLVLCQLALLLSQPILGKQITRKHCTNPDCDDSDCTVTLINTNDCVLLKSGDYVFVSLCEAGGKVISEMYSNAGCSSSSLIENRTHKEGECFPSVNGANYISYICSLQATSTTKLLPIIIPSVVGGIVLIICTFFCCRTCNSCGNFFLLSAEARAGQSRNKLEEYVRAKSKEYSLAKNRLEIEWELHSHVTWSFGAIEDTRDPYLPPQPSCKPLLGGDAYLPAFQRPSPEVYERMVELAGGNREWVEDFLYEKRCAAQAAALGYLDNINALKHPWNVGSKASQDPRSAAQRKSFWLPQAPSLSGKSKKSERERVKGEQAKLRLLPRQLWVCRTIVLPDKADDEVLTSKRLEQREKDLVYKEISSFPLSSISRAPYGSPGGLLAYAEYFPFILNAVYGDWRHDRYLALCRLMGCPLVDRTGILSSRGDCPLNVVVAHPLPSFDPAFNMTLPEIMLARAEALLALARHTAQPLNVLWSGGLDTTAVVVAFLKVTEDAPYQRKEHIIIRYRPDSKDENPGFFEAHIAPNFNHRVIEEHVRDALYDPSVDHLVTGDPCDMLFGTFLMADSFKPRYDEKLIRVNPMHGRLDDDWRTTLADVMHSRGLLGKLSKDADPGISTPEESDTADDAINATQSAANPAVLAAKAEWVEWIEPLMQAAPIPIRTTFDALWWLAYSQKYQHDLLRIFYNIPTQSYSGKMSQPVEAHIRSKVKNFYETPMFDQWSFHCHHLKMADHCVWTTYKQPLKHFITGYASKEYLTSKIKVVSTRNSFGLEVGIDQNWCGVRFGEFSVSQAKLEALYGTGDELWHRFLHPVYMKRLKENASLRNCGTVEKASKYWSGGAVAGAAVFME